MNKTAEIELYRLFIVDALPDPLTTASAHLQIFDTYIPGTRLRVRQMRDPSTNSWSRVLQQRYFVRAGETATSLIEIHLNDDEFAVFERIRGSETRKNRYFHEFDRREVIFDVYLGALRGLMTAKVEFSPREAMLDLLDYEPPPFMKLEVTEDPFFGSAALSDKSFKDVQAEIVRVASKVPRATRED